jgi:cytochrome P450
MTLPEYDVDLFTDAALDDPYPHYRALRDLGPVVRLTAHDVLAVTRYDDVRQVVDTPDTFCSGSGVGLNDFINMVGRGTTLMSDGETHRRQREVIGRPLTPKALSLLQPDVQALADDLVARLVDRRSFDAVPDLAQVIPTTWVPDLLGWPAGARHRLVDWGSDNFDALGPFNDRTAAAGAGLLEMAGFAQQVAADGDLPAGSMAAGVLAAAGRGEIEPAQCHLLLIDYLAPSLDTTISAIGNALWLFGTHPDQWDRLRAEPGRVKNAFNEAVRLETPISCFTRVATADTRVGGSPVADGSRLLVSFASANRDERRWKEADRFDIGREAAGHLGYGHGVHACAGMGLARLEGAAVLSALAARVGRIEVGTPVRKYNNLIRSFASLPVTLHPA